ncbi:MAG: flagellar hook protein FlgE [Cellulosilyticaceae bacterium]
MMRSMYSGVSGLRVHQTKMDVIGNNIANVNTNGYKSQRVTFNDVFSQTLQSATGASEDTGRGGRNPMQVGLGVNVSSVDMLMTPGAAQRTDNPFDLMVDGDGFLVVGDNSGTYFTRAGALRLDEKGNLVIPNGMKVKGWPADDKGEKIVQGEVQELNLNKFYSAEPTASTEIKITGNLNPTDSPVSAQIKFYDSLGNFYTSNIQLHYNVEAGKATWDVEPVLVDATGKISDKPDSNTFLKLTDEKGNVYLSGSGTPAVPEGKDTSGNIVSRKAATHPLIAGSKNPKLSFDTNGAFTGISEPLEIKELKLNTFTMLDSKGNAKGNGPNATAGGITANLSGLTQYSSKTNLDTTANGQKAGTLSGYDIGADGIISAYYDNGDRKVLGQVVVAQFANPAGLEKAGSNLFRATNNSGDFDNIGAAGSFQAGVLEMSNVDLSQEFTEMITTQRGFQANSRIISTSDEMLQELVNIKR